MEKDFFDWGNGKTYSGDFYEDKKQGYGTFQWPKGIKYEGGWLDNQKHGMGTIFMENKKRKGEWELGKRIRWITEDKDINDEGQFE